MNVLQVNYTDVLGHRFNGGAINSWLRERGHNACHAVGVKQDEGSDSVELTPPSMRLASKALSRIAGRLEAVTSLQSIFYPQSFLLPFNAEFKAADVVHYHIVHNHFFSHLAFPRLTKLKPSVWSLHDPWAFTGHCVHPFECEGWKTGCSPCPHLDYPFAIRHDSAWLNFKLKDLSYRKSSLQLIVASRWMQRLVEQSPLMQRFQTHLIPFGLDLHQFKPGDKAQAKAKLGIAPNRIVVGLRSLEGPYKGLEYSIKALQLLPPDLPIHLLTCQRTGKFASIAGKFPMTELGEIDDESMVDFFQATDVHLMPSMAESFGMMAMEAAACGIPSIVFDETPLPDVCFAPEGGISVKRGDPVALAAAIAELVQDGQRRSAMGQRARVLAEINYGFDKHANAILGVYEKARADFSRAKA
jgi:glycosyltransferase involved in cell wall biosynthesis